VWILLLTKLEGGRVYLGLPLDLSNMKTLFAAHQTQGYSAVS
jgi:hypothetical protein